MRPFLVLAIICLLGKIIDARAVENDIDKNQRGKRRQKFSIEELLTVKFSHIITGDLDIDICKAGGFLGDIALPNIKYETEWREQKLNKSYLEELKKYREEILNEGLQVEEEGLTGTKILQFKSERGVNEHMLTEHGDAVIQKKPKSIMIDRNQYKMDDEPDGDFSFNHRSDNINPAVKNEGFAIRLESSTQASKKRYFEKQARRQISRTVSISESVKAKYSNHDIPLEFLPSTAFTTEGNKYIGHVYTDSIKETFNAKPEMNTQNPSNRRQRRHHRKRILGRCSQRHCNRRMHDFITDASDEIISIHDRHLRSIEFYDMNHKSKYFASKRGTKNFLSRIRRAATARKERVWDHGVIPYEIDGNFSGAHKALFKQAMRHWENFTCVKFVERVSREHPNYILFTERPCGCCSFVGKRGNGPQAISIGKNCDKFGIVVHELGHVVGFWHEHTRPDRDRHVQIIRDNIMSGQEYNFNKLTEEEVNSLGLPYDYDSIMHYAKNTFSKGTYLDTILPMESHGKKRPEIGQRIRLSEGDIAQTNLLYKCHKCGRTFQENSGVFGSPNNSPSTDGDRCEWRITATHGERIVLNITFLDILKSNFCRSDYLEIRDGYWYKSRVLGRYCGSGKMHEPIVSSGSRMLVTYVTSSKLNSHRGFTASYEAVCGGDVELDGIGHLESPNYPEEYQSSKECVWKLSVPNNYQVALKFQSFEIENHDNCVYDYVEVRDGHNNDSPLIGVYCGYKIPPDIKSTGNKLLVKFVSDGSVQKAGFSATFMKEFDECVLTDHGCEHDCTNTLGGYECSCKIGYELHSDGKHCEDACGGFFDDSNGTITSPSFPEAYPGNKNCVWEIIAPPQYRITLNFTHFDLEGNNLYQEECEYDSVEVASKLGDDVLRKHGLFCGVRLPPLITSEGNFMRITFTSDNSVQKSGFAAIFFTDMDECANNNGGCQHECKNTIGSYQCSCHNGFTLHENGLDCKEGGCKYEITAPVGTITSPNYPDYYPSRKDCVWHFTTKPGHRIKLVFKVFEMESHQECAYDHIAIYDGDSADSLTLGRFCGTKGPHPILATGNQMYMVFKSDASVQRKGFLAIHSTACGGHLMATDKTKYLYSHAKYGYHNYDHRTDCDWIIEAPLGKSIRLSFLSFQLEYETECGYDFVEVFSGLDASSPPYGRFCGNSNATDFYSINEALLVRFRTDDTISGKGFKAVFVAIDRQDSEENFGGEEDEDQNL
ncbi:tolloid-like protein 2 isoform X1 [Cataglyphis hispanica]|uniref:tolloid-like protein 2 isoform X1 n=1 Tax=Cataglyphis hispanica TaxID=1086592 RepID=UPI00217F7B89|nr:tolloid-like protein 2 isoform X1 [Cataglyphis hispanica]